jgi:hypothetical protein
MSPPAKVHKKDIIALQKKSDPTLKHVLVEYVPKHGAGEEN